MSLGLGCPGGVRISKEGQIVASQLVTDLTKSIEACDTIEALEGVRVSIFGKKGILTESMKGLAQCSPDEKKVRGKELNDSKEILEALLLERRAVLSLSKIQEEVAKAWGDITLDSQEVWEGKLHPLTRTQERILEFFGSRGFHFAQGPQIETQDNNFTFLNMPDHHPARQSQDTFYLKAINPDKSNEPLLLRTHTSTVQIRQMQHQKPPFRLLSLGSVFRSDYDATHTPMFHQLEGLVIEKHIDMGHLKGILTDFLTYFFDDKNLKIRFRPSYFPFTEPGAEVDIGYSLHEGKVRLGGDEKWLEVLGCGMVHPNVLKNCAINPENNQGFAFGMGLERLTMLKGGMSDLRPFFEGDLRWLSHYGYMAMFKPLLGQGDI